MSTDYISHPACLRHKMGEQHPECPERLIAVELALRKAGLWEQLEHLQAPLASREQLSMAHHAEYVESIFARAPQAGQVMLDPDTSMNPWSLEAARRAAGAGILAVDRLLSGASKRAFCNVRPPGHHAEADKAMGFCLFNNIAVAAFYALQQPGIERVAVVDFDVHHGNGSEDILRREPRALYCSSFQDPFYPGYWRDSLAGSLVNVPLPANTGSADFRRAISAQWLPALEDFAPDLLLVSAGFDAHRDDPLASLHLDEADYAWVTAQLLQVAERSAQGRMLSMLEGGYALEALGLSAAAHVREMLAN